MFFFVVSTFNTFEKCPCSHNSKENLVLQQNHMSNAVVGKENLNINSVLPAPF